MTILLYYFIFIGKLTVVYDTPSRLGRSVTNNRNCPGESADSRNAHLSQTEASAEAPQHSARGEGHTFPLRMVRNGPKKQLKALKR